MVLKDGTLLQGGKYRIVRFISAGGFGCTYEGVHVMLKKRVAIKEFFVKDFCNRDDATTHVTVGAQSKVALVEKLRNKFIDEAVAISQLSHPSIVHVYEVFEENATAYYIMDYIDGPSLYDIVKLNGAMNEKMGLKYIRQIADALKHVHSHNRLHLDVKPGNIMIDKNDNAILIDFGTSKQYDEEAGENTSTLIGKTPGYAPLEQMGNDVVNFYPATDIYSLGATLYKLLTGKTPISANHIASGEEQEPLPMSISENVRNAVNKAMQTNKKMRPQSIDEFLQILNTSVDDTTIYNDESTIYDNNKHHQETLRHTKIKAEHKVRKKDIEKERVDETRAKNSSLTKFIVIIGVILIGGLLIYYSIQSNVTSSTGTYDPQQTSQETNDTDEKATNILDAAANEALNDDNKGITETSSIEVSEHDRLINEAMSIGRKMADAIQSNNLTGFRRYEAQLDEMFENAPDSWCEEADQAITDIYNRRGITDDELFAFTEQYDEGN